MNEPRSTFLSPPPIIISWNLLHRKLRCTENWNQTERRRLRYLSLKREDREKKKEKITKSYETLKINKKEYWKTVDILNIGRYK